MASSGVGQLGIIATRAVATTQLFVDDINATPVLNVSHTAQGGSLLLSAGQNPQQGFSVTPVALGNSQLLAGPNILVSNTLSVPNQFSVGYANVANALNVTGPSTLIGNVALQGNTVISGSANVVSNLTVGNTISVPYLRGNTATLVGPQANLYLETTSNLASTTSALYLGPTWRVKILSTNGLAFQSFNNGSWFNSSVLAPAGASVSIGALSTPTT